MTIRELWLRLTFPLRRRRVERELREEIALHVALRAEEMQRAGWTTEDAADGARRQFGNRSRIAAASRDIWGWQWIDGFLQDVVYVARQLRHAPVFTVVASLTIAFGIAINATAFTFYNAIVLKPLSVRDPSRMIRIVQARQGFGAELLPFVAYDILQRGTRSVQSVVLSTGPQSLSAVLPAHATDDSRVITARFVIADFARQLGLRASVGRWFDAADDGIVLDYRFWTRALAADPSVVGQRIRVGGVDLAIVGVASEDFAGTGLPATAPDVWLPLSTMATVMPNTDWRHDARSHWQMLGRLAPNASLSEANAELALLSRSVIDSAGKPLPLIAKHATFFQAGAGEFEVFQQVSVALMIALALILGIAVVNLVNLFGARHAAREREVCVRLALGASRARIASQLASESVLLALIGGVIGLIAAHRAAIWLRDWISGTMASISGGIVGVFLDVGLDWRVALYAALLSALIGLAVGMWPAFRASRSDVSLVLREGVTTTAGTAAWSKRNLLLGAQVAGSIVLLTAAGMLLSGIRLARDIDPGFDADHMLVVDVADQSPATLRAVRRAEIVRRISALPEIRAASWSQRVPFAGTHLRRATRDGAPVTVSIDNVAETYFDVMGIPIVRGRNFTTHEIATNAPVMVVSEATARLRWPTGDAIGKSVAVNSALAGPDTTQSYTVIGVVRDIRSNFLSRVNGPSVYYPADLTNGFGAILARTRGNPGSAVNAVRKAVADVSPSLISQTHVLTMRGGPMALQQLMAEVPAMVALALALAGLALASVGVYGLISQIVTRRTREIGVHVAMGAQPRQVIALVAKKTLRPVLWGTVVGGLGAFGLSFFLRSLIAMPDVPDLTFGAGAFNPLVFMGVLAVLGLVVVAACYLPARRAAMVDPTVALRAE
jgi:predicted permease